MRLFFFHPDCTVGIRISRIQSTLVGGVVGLLQPESKSLPVRSFTFPEELASRALHRAPRLITVERAFLCHAVVKTYLMKAKKLKGIKGGLIVCPGYAIFVCFGAGSAAVLEGAVPNSGTITTKFP